MRDTVPRIQTFRSGHKEILPANPPWRRQSARLGVEKCVFDNEAVRQANYRILGPGFGRAF